MTKVQVIGQGEKFRCYLKYADGRAWIELAPRDPHKAPVELGQLSKVGRNWNLNGIESTTAQEVARQTWIRFVGDGGDTKASVNVGGKPIKIG